jgi:hypothetical protein
VLDSIGAPYGNRTRVSAVKAVNTCALLTQVFNMEPMWGFNAVQPNGASNVAWRLGGDF